MTHLSLIDNLNLIISVVKDSLISLRDVIDARSELQRNAGKLQQQLLKLVVKRELFSLGGQTWEEKATVSLFFYAGIHEHEHGTVLHPF